ncbi:GLPGLI family protein [Pontibacter burrus]|uniref:GLPGLI family protein n=1 Tax=Pontibacter burrus TaxID=2704466 RepID=A0A6B3LS27_9BACT|nr:GLPGLI family protein [Pontibacter burrus]NEM97006.1 GLPGLI family protein [Pontibacter burrus]
MNKIFTIVVACLFWSGTVAQQQESVITYEVKQNMHRGLSADQENMKNMLPEFRTSKMQLLFNNQESLYAPVQDEEDDMEAGSGGVRIMVRTPYSETYTNSSTQKVVSYREFLGKNYLIQDSIRINPWKFSSETKTIQGYICKKAYYTNDNQQLVTAWYTEQLRPYLGPDAYNNLPGTVLQVDVNEGERILTAIRVETRPLKKNELKEPVKGQAVTAAEFRKQVEEQRERMNREGGRTIRFNN